jgi:LysM repeat protein
MPAMAFCQDEAATGSSFRDGELAALRTAVERQSAKIDELTREVARLAAAIAKSQPAAPAAPSSTTEAVPAQEAADAEAAKPTPAGVTHVVAKGETLTSIARHYKVGVGELLQANKIVDDRRLQIGQTIVIPTKTENTETEQKPTGVN